MYEFAKYLKAPESPCSPGGRAKYTSMVTAIAGFSTALKARTQVHRLRKRMRKLEERLVTASKADAVLDPNAFVLVKQMNSGSRPIQPTSWKADSRELRS